MSIYEKIERLQVAKDATIAVMKEKGVNVPEGAGFEDFPELTESIQTGGNTDIATKLLEGTIDTYSDDKITAIRRNGFSFSNVVSVRVPNATSLGESGFSNCKKLVHVEAPLLKTISNYAFNACTELETISLPSLRSAGTNAFYQCSKLTTVNLQSITHLSTYMFDNCTSLERFDVPLSVTQMGCAFNKATSLHTVIVRSENIVQMTAVSFPNTPIAKGTGYIYVPKALIEDYKVATNWITYAEQLRAIEDYPEICGGAEND